MFFEHVCGEMAEWSIATVLKTVIRDERIVGSNPTLSSRLRQKISGKPVLSRVATKV